MVTELDIEAGPAATGDEILEAMNAVMTLARQYRLLTFDLAIRATCYADMVDDGPGSLKFHLDSQGGVFILNKVGTQRVSEFLKLLCGSPDNWVLNPQGAKTLNVILGLPAEEGVGV